MAVGMAVIVVIVVIVAIDGTSSGHCQHKQHEAHRNADVTRRFLPFPTVTMLACTKNMRATERLTVLRLILRGLRKVISSSNIVCQRRAISQKRSITDHDPFSISPWKQVCVTVCNGFSCANGT